MPSRTSDGKRLSGHAQRKLAGEPLPPFTRAARKALGDVGPPELDDPDHLLSWARKLDAVCLWLVACDQIDPRRARLITEHVKTLGVTHNRGRLESKVKKLKAALADRVNPGAVRVAKGSEVKPSPNARGMPRKPRALPPAPPEDPPQEPST